VTERALRIAVIGHTNTGKTSVLRTLLRDPSLGVVADEPGTTREPSTHTLRAGAESIELMDTPGLEDAASVLWELRDIEERDGLSPADALDRLLAEPGALAAETAAELGPLRVLAGADAGLLIFDAREPPRAKHWEEYELLRRCGRPIIAVLNCVVSPGARHREWEAGLRRHGLHAVVEFDAWAADEGDAALLLIKLRELLGGDWRPRIDGLIAARKQAQQRRALAMAEVLAALAVDLVTHRRTASVGKREEGAADLAADLEEGWARFRRALAEIHGVDERRLAAVEARLDAKLAAATGSRPAETAKAGSAAASAAILGGLVAGVAKGGVVDLAAGGATLGLGAAAGGALGFAVGGRELSRHAVQRMAGRIELAISEPAIEGALRRGLWLIERLRFYGHASERPVEAPPALGDDDTKRLPVRKRLRALRTHRSWCRLTEGQRTTRGERPAAAQRAIESLGRALASRLPAHAE